MNSWAKIGAKCVCVDARPGGATKGVATVHLIEKEEYTIEAIEWNEFSVPAVKVSGNGYTAEAMRWGWLRLSRFRPLVTERDDVEMFEKLAGETKVDLLLDALNAAWELVK